MADTKADRAGDLAFLPLGGIGEIGMNAYLYGLGPARSRQWLMVDLGITFPGPQEPGVDVILPDIRFIVEERANLAGILLTHAHEDHFGAVTDLWSRLKVPVYATPFTAALLRAKAEENGVGSDLPLTEVAMGSRFTIGPFDVELVTMSHSIPEPNAVVLRTDRGLVVHSADWKMDPDPRAGPPIDETRLREIGAEGVDVLICDSTNAMSEGHSGSEADVARTLAEIIAEAPQRVAVTTFASNVARIRAVAEAARAAGRELVVSGRALWRVIAVAQETGYLDPDLRFLDQEQFGYFPRDKVVLLCTGSQGESRAALAKISQDQHPEIALSRGDMVIFSSRTIPGNEKAVGRIQNALAERGIRIVTERTAPVHVSGHPRRQELAKLYEWLRPRALIPMHGEPMHLAAHARFARRQGVDQVLTVWNGALVSLLPGPPEVVDEAPTGRIFRDGRLLVPEADPALALRRKLSFVGAVTVSLMLTRRGDFSEDPICTLLGLPETDEAGRYLQDLVEEAVLGAVESIPRPRRKDSDLVAEAVRRAVRAEVNQIWGKRPVCVVHVHRT